MLVLGSTLKSFTGLEKEFGTSRVGFYTSSQDNFDKHKQRESITILTPILNGEDYDLYEHQSKLPIGPGVQARFMLNDDEETEEIQPFPSEYAKLSNRCSPQKLLPSKKEHSPTKETPTLR
ncbi:hypothetical protein AOLI_G00199470 [Acnodon oligacanthus]